MNFPRNGWRAANNGSGTMRWFVFYVKDYRETEAYHKDKRGDLIRFKTFEAADRRAKMLNTKEGTSE